ncbi:hypothetical protein [Streptomyces coeruleorubidus]
MGSLILGTIPVERRVVVFATIGVAGPLQLERHTIAQSFRAGAWRVVALETGFNTSADSHT